MIQIGIIFLRGLKENMCLIKKKKNLRDGVLLNLPLDISENVVPEL